MNKKQKHMTQISVDSQRYVTLDFGPLNQFKDMHSTSKGFGLFGLSFIRKCGSTKFFNYVGDEVLQQCFSTFVRPRPGKFFFYKTRARSQQIYS